MIKGHYQTWFKQKNVCLNNLCLIGEGSQRHQTSMIEYKRVKTIKERATTAASNLFRAAIIDLRLGAAVKHFETLISFLACCSVDVGKIGHGRNNFNDIVYCLENKIDTRIAEWLRIPLLSTTFPLISGQQWTKQRHPEQQTKLCRLLQEITPVDLALFQ